MAIHRPVPFWLILTLCLLLGGVSAAGIQPPDAVQSADLPSRQPMNAVAGAPDLIVESITLTPANPGVGGIADITVVLKNQGDVDATGFTVYLYVESADDPPTQNSPATAQTFYGLTLTPNDTFSWERTGQAFTTAQPVVYVWIDPPWENRVAEANEENNLLRTPATTPPTATPSPTLATQATPASTSTPTATNGPSQVYLAMIVKMPTPTATPTPTAIATTQPVWRRVGNGGISVAALATVGEELFAGERRNTDTNHPGGLYRRSRTACTSAPAFVRTLTIDSTLSSLAFYGMQGVLAAYDAGLYASQDGGQSWQPAADRVVHPGTVAVSSTGRFYAGAQDGGVYQSDDGGQHWQALSWPPRAINRLKFAGDTLWIGTQTGVWKVAPGTAQPSDQSAGLLDEQSKQVWDLAFTSADTLYLATFNGVYQGDGVNPWQPWGLQGRELYSLALADEFLYAGARPSPNDPARVAGVWRRPLTGGDWQPVTSADWQPTYIVRDLLYDTTCQGLLAATNDGVWIFR